MNIKMQCCGVILLLVILYFYICRKKIKLTTAQAFMRIFVISLLSLILDIASVILLSHHEAFPEILIDIVCKTYLATLVLTAMAAFLYICTDIYGGAQKLRNMGLFSIAATTIGIILIFILPIGKSWKDPNHVYTYGSSVMITYAFTVFFLICIIILLISQKRKIDKRRRDAMRTWMILWLVATAIQFTNNELLLVGFAGTIGIMIIYLKLENPELNIDKSTGLFNQEGMLLYINQILRSGQTYSLLALTTPDAVSVRSAVEERNMVRIEMNTYLMGIQDAYAFKNREDEVVLIFKDIDKADKCREIIRKRFESGWGKAKNTYINPKWIYMPDGSIATTGEDVINLLDYARTNGVNYTKDDTILIEAQMADAMYEEANMELLILNALENDMIEVFYQPIFSTKEQRFTAAEALVRIRDREGRLVPPGLFIGIAEKNGSIIKLGEAVFEKVCRFLKKYQPEQYGLQYIEVNLSVVQCAYENLAKSYINIMQKYGIAPDRINLEITESASVEAKKVLLHNMETLMQYGVKFSLDDFGTGQSNLNYIMEMPVDIVKFDRDMTISYFENGKARYVMDAAMSMIHGMKLEIVSEGIETKNQFDTMQKLGICYIQGYYFSKPLPEQEFLAFIESNYKKL